MERVCPSLYSGSPCFFLLLASHFPHPPNWLAEHVSEMWVDPSSTSWQSFAQLQLCDVPRSCTTTPPTLLNEMLESPIFQIKSKV